MMNIQGKKVFGAVIAAVGTVISAVGSTTSKLNEAEKDTLHLWGNVLQASGNALLAETEEDFSLSQIGNNVQAIGNSTIITGIIIDFKDVTKEKLNITGNWIQALGGTAGFAEVIGSCSSKNEMMKALGELLQVIGNSLQAISLTNELKEIGEKEKNLMIDAIGSWIQSIGSIIVFLTILFEIDIDTEKYEKQIGPLPRTPYQEGLQQTLRYLNEKNTFTHQN